MYSSEHLLHSGHQKIYLATWKFAQGARLAIKEKKLTSSPDMTRIYYFQDQHRYSMDIIMDSLERGKHYFEMVSEAE